MKKLLCLILILSILVPVPVIAVNAETSKETLETDYYEYLLTMYPTPDEAYFPYVSVRDHEQTRDVILFTALAWFNPADVPIIRVFDDWFVYSPNFNQPSAVGIYAKHNDTIYTLEEAWEKGLVTDFSCINSFKSKCAGRYGDADRNGKVNVKDATTIQKSIAGLNVNMEKDALTNILCDFHYDQKVNIKDATAIQKHIAGLEPMQKPIQENYTPF